jgi:hypothetical protein
MRLDTFGSPISRSPFVVYTRWLIVLNSIGNGAPSKHDIDPSVVPSSPLMLETAGRLELVTTLVSH